LACHWQAFGMTTQTSTKTTTGNADALFSVGAQYGYSRSRRHPSTNSFIFGVKNNVEIFDLEKTQKKLDEALAFVKSLGSEGKTILMVSGKPESKHAVRTAHDKTKLPYVIGRWIGGTLTNFEVIRKRVDRLVDLRTRGEQGGLEKYTKRERLLMRREADRLSHMFEGIVGMEKLPSALFVIDPRREHTAVREARHRNISVIALASSDCNVADIDYLIPANDANIKSVTYFVDRIADSYSDGLKEKPVKKPVAKTKSIKSQVTSED